MTCVICGQGGAGEALANGGAYHAACYQALAAQFQELKTRKDALEQDRLRLRKERAALQATLAGKILTLFQANRPRIRARTRRLRAAIREITAITEQLTRVKKELYDLHSYWPTEPPDWPDRRLNAIARSPRCGRCGRAKNLEVRHIVPPGKGGSHLPANLQVLCDWCSPHRPGTPDPQRGPRDESHLRKKLDLIREAIDKGAAIQFLYRRRGQQRGRETAHKVRPTSLKRIGKLLCVRGLCLARRKPRTFAIRRMKRVKITTRV